MQADPRHAIEAPVRRALAAIVVRGLVLVAAILLAVLCPTIPQLYHLRDALAVVVAALLIGYATAVLVERRLRGPVDPELRKHAWFKARDIDEADAALVLVIAGWVPVALLAALVVMAWPHLMVGTAEARGLWFAVGVPALFVAWVVATSAWLDGCRDDLARAIGESERRFRSYWANVGR